MYKDIDDVELKDGDIIDINQTVNGASIFVVNMNDKELEIRYAANGRKYEYDSADLLAPDKFTSETTWKIVGSIK